MAVVQCLQVAPLLLAIFGRGDAALWTAALIGSSICCAGTDSGWRWRNRALVMQAVLWLFIPPLFPR